MFYFFIDQHIELWPVGQVVKTPPFHGGNMGSNPVRVIEYADLAQLVEQRYRKPWVTGSTPAISMKKRS